MVITDGHPDCVKNQKVCIEMNRQKGVFARGQRLGPALSGQGLGPALSGQGLGPAPSGQGLGCVDSASGSNACVIASHLLRWSVDDSLGDFRVISETRVRASDSIGRKANVVTDTLPTTTSPLTSQQAPLPPPLTLHVILTLTWW